MVLAKLEHAHHYYSIHPLFQKAFEYLKGSFSDKDKVELEGESLFALYSAKQGKSLIDAKLEAHRRYIDIQFLVAGEEKIGWKPTEECKMPQSGFDFVNDFILFDDEPQQYLSLLPGEFVIFFPEDAHAPMIGDDTIKKIVVKVEL